jgi:hypothetical protein
LFVVLNQVQGQHPVRQEIVNDIRLNAKSWRAKDPSLNFLNKVPSQHISRLGGNLGLTPASNSVWSHVEQEFNHIIKSITGRLVQHDESVQISASSYDVRTDPFDEPSLTPIE